MAIFLVNQGQTYKYEREGGYIWSPKLNKAGQRNRGYDLMKEVRRGDYILHNSGGKISAISVVKEDCKSGSQPRELKTANAFTSGMMTAGLSIQNIMISIILSLHLIFGNGLSRIIQKIQHFKRMESCYFVIFAIFRYHMLSISFRWPLGFRRMKK